MTNEDSFANLLEGLTPLQLDWIAIRIDTGSDREASRRLKISRSTPSRWKAEGVPIDEIVKQAKQDGVILVQERIKGDLNWAYDVKREGLQSRSERMRQLVASEILDRGLGKATQRQEIGGEDGGDIVIRFTGNIRPDDV